jgi:hypothetical protein
LNDLPILLINKDQISYSKFSNVILDEVYIDLSFFKKVLGKLNIQFIKQLALPAEAAKMHLIYIDDHGAHTIKANLLCPANRLFIYAASCTVSETSAVY